MGANIIIKDLNNCIVNHEHSRGIRSIMVGADVDSVRLSHLEYITYYGNGECPIHVHDDSEEIFYFIRGTGTFYLGDQEIKFKPGDQICVPKGLTHGLKCDPDVVTEHLVACVNL